MVFKIQKFASFLCLVHGTNQGIDQLLPEYFAMTDYSEEIHIVVQKLCLMYENLFIPIVQRLTDAESLESFDSFAKVNLAWYVKMSEFPTYFKFIVICCLVKTIASEMFARQNCFCFPKVLSLCLIALYNRCYDRLFCEKESERSESLGSYCKEINSRYLHVSEVGQLPISLRLESRVMLSSLDNIDLDNFSLTNTEKNMLNDALDSVPPEGNLPEDEVTTTTPCDTIVYENATILQNTLLDLSAVQCNLPEDVVTTTTPDENNSYFEGASNAEVLMDYLNAYESIDASSKLSDVCVSCNRKCFRYVMAFNLENTEESIYYNY